MKSSLRKQIMEHRWLALILAAFVTLATGQRPPAYEKGKRLPDDRILLGKVQVRIQSD